jgi:hypothetical protein
MAPYSDVSETPKRIREIVQKIWKFRNDRKNANRKAKKAKAAAEEFSARLKRINLRNYRKMSLQEKFEFAAGGYRFTNNPGEPCIKIGQTNLRTPPGRNRGVRVGLALDELPEGFVILYSHYSISTTPSRNEQRHYQVGLPGGRYMKIHTRPTEPFGLANFINSALPGDTSIEVALDPVVGQNMKNAQCVLKHTIQGVTADLKERFPAYVQTMQAIPQGHELLMRYGSSYRLGTNSEMNGDVTSNV